MSKLIYSPAVSEYPVLSTAVNFALRGKRSELKLSVDFSIYKNRTSLKFKHADDTDNSSRFVQVVIGETKELLNVTYFGSPEVITNPRVIRNPTKRDFVQEVIYANLFDYSTTEEEFRTRVGQLAEHIVHFMDSGDVATEEELNSMFPALVKTVKEVNTPTFR